jgi:flagellar hook-basal body complex protein FliE
MVPISAIAPMLQSHGLRPTGGIGAADLMPEIHAPAGPTSPSEAGSVQPAGESFANVLGRMVGEVNGRQLAANDAVAALQSGQNTSLHQAVIAMEEANISFQLMVEVRNKLLDSYQELMRMQI